MGLPTHDAVAGLCPDDGTTVTFEWDETDDEGNGLTTGIPGGIYVGVCPHCHRRLVREHGPIVTTIGGGPSPIDVAVDAALARRKTGIVASPDNTPGETFTRNDKGEFVDAQGHVVGMSTDTHADADAQDEPEIDIDQRAPDVPSQIRESDENRAGVFPPTDVRETIATEPENSAPDQDIDPETGLVRESALTNESLDAAARDGVLPLGTNESNEGDGEPDPNPAS